MASRAGVPANLKYNLRRLYEAPELLTSWEEREQGDRHADWQELFFDLYYVAGVSAVTELLASQPDWTGFAHFMLYFTLLHSTWSSHSFLMTRIHAGGLGFDTLRFLRHLGVLGMVYGAHNWEDYPLFCGSYAVVRVVAIIQEALVSALLPPARALTLLSAVIYSAITALALGGVFGSLRLHWQLLTVCAVLEVTAPLAVLALPERHRHPLHVEHLHERLGLLMIIYLGESIVALGGTTIVPGLVLQLVGAGLASAVVWVVFLSLFHMEVDQHDHALRQGKARGMVYNYAHLVLGAAINILGAGIVLAMASYPDIIQEPAPAPVLPAGVASAEPASSAVGAAPAESGRRLLAATGGSGSKPAPCSGNPCDGDVSLAAALCLCVGYGVALHTIVLIRATHFLRPRSGHPLDRVAKALQASGYLQAWRGFCLLWPAIAYPLTLTYGSIGTTALLGVLAVHAVVFVLVETSLSDRLTGKVEQHLAEYAWESSDGSGEGVIPTQLGEEGTPSQGELLSEDVRRVVETA